MPYKLRISNDTVSLIRGLHPELKKRVKMALQEITNDPYTGKALKDKLQRLLSYRIKKIRVIYRFTSKKHIDIIALGPRSFIYEKTYKLLKKNK